MGWLLDVAKSQITSRFCPMPFTNFVLSSYGTYRPCCEYEGGLEERGEQLQLSTTGFHEAWNSKALRDLRLKFLSGIKPKECWKCWREEAAGIKSLRQAVLEPFSIKDVLSFKNFVNIATGFRSPRSLNLGLSNLCNLKCRICGPLSSTMWEKEYLEKDGLVLDNQSKNTLNDANCKTLKEWLPNLDRIEVLGGEPLMNKEFYKLLDICLASGYAKNLTIHCNSNGTVFSKRFVELFDEFKSVSLYFSIDDLGDRFTFQRYPAKWESVEKNLRKYERARKSTTELGIVATVSLFNVFYVPEFIEWISSHSIKPTFHILHAPDYFSIVNLPDACKKYVTERLKSIDDWPYSDNREEIQGMIQFMNMPGNPNSVREALAEIENIDKHRGNSFHRTFPEMAELLHSAYIRLDL